MALTSISPDLLYDGVHATDDWFLVDVWAHHCAPCKGVEQLLELLAPDLPSYCRVVKVCADDFPDWSGELGIRAVPLLLLFREGQEIARQQGDMSATAIRAFLEQHLPAQRDPEVHAEMLLGKGQLDELSAYLQTLKDEQSRGPGVQRARSWLSMMALPLDAQENDLRVAFFEIARSGHWQRVLEMLSGAIQSNPQLRPLAVALADLIPDRGRVAEWRRALRKF